MYGQAQGMQQECAWKGTQSRVLYAQEVGRDEMTSELESDVRQCARPYLQYRLF